MASAKDLHLTVHVQLEPADLEPILQRLARIERALIKEEKMMTDFHDELDADLAELVQLVADDDAELARELADFAAAVSPKLTDDERAQLASVAQKLADFKTSIETVDPTLPAPEPTV